jgi:hypothetical protein
MKTLSLFLLCFALSGCAGVQQPIVSYADISPKVVEATSTKVYKDQTGASVVIADRYLVDAQGNAAPVKQDTTSIPSLLGGIVQSGVSSGSATAVTGAILPLIFPPATVTTTVKTGGK